MFQIRLEGHWARYRRCYQFLFYSILTLGLYLGVRSSPLPHVMRLGVSDSLYHGGGLFVCTVLSYVAYPRWPLWLRGALMFSLGRLLPTGSGWRLGYWLSGLGSDA